MCVLSRHKTVPCMHDRGRDGTPRAVVCSRGGQYNVLVAASRSVYRFDAEHNRNRTQNTEHRTQPTMEDDDYIDPLPQILGEEVRCPACDVVMVGPRVFGCGHAACTPCCRVIEEGARAAGRYVACPACDVEDGTPWRRRPIVRALDALCRASASYPRDAAEILAQAEAAPDDGAARGAGAERAEYERRIAAYVDEQVRAVRAASWRALTTQTPPPPSCAVELPPAAAGVVERIMRECARATGALAMRVVESTDDAGEVDGLRAHLVWDRERCEMTEIRHMRRRMQRSGGRAERTIDDTDDDWGVHSRGDARPGPTAAEID